MNSDPTYILWHPAIVANSSHQEIVTINVTPLAFNKMPNGPSSFFDILLADIGTQYKAHKWSILPYRSNYHADRADYDDWRDFWLQNWRISIIILDTNESYLEFEDEYFETQAYSIDGIDLNMGNNCMIISDFKDRISRYKACDLISQSSDVINMRKLLGAPEPDFYGVDIGDTFFQLQICLGEFPDTFFNGNFQYASIIEDICRSCEGITSFDERADQWGEL